LLGSGLTSVNEKKVVEVARNNFTALQKQFSGAQRPTRKAVEHIASSFDDLWKIFSGDAKSRQPYRAPNIIQSVEDVLGGRVMETYVINDDGSATVHVGGEKGIPPGPSEDWINAFKEKNNIK